MKQSMKILSAHECMEKTQPLMVTRIWRALAYCLYKFPGPWFPKDVAALLKSAPLTFSTFLHLVE